MQPLNISSFLKNNHRSFRIIEEFAELNHKRKMVLCDEIYYKNYKSFEKSVHLMWPEATDADIKKLRNFIAVLLSSRSN